MTRREYTELAAEPAKPPRTRHQTLLDGFSYPMQELRKHGEGAGRSLPKQMRNPFRTPKFFPEVLKP